MFFSRITLHTKADEQRGFWEIFKNTYALHQAVWQLFADSPDRDRDFIYRFDQVKHRPFVYAVSKREPLDGKDLWRIESKVYHPKLASGTCLSFLLRANPVRTKRDEAGRQHRHDVVMDATTCLKAEKADGVSAMHAAALIQEAGGRWLSDRAEKNGFRVEPGALRVDGYQQHRFLKGKGARRISISTLDFSGVLKVTDTVAFLQTLYEGIGPAKAFGCGMLMVRRV